MMIEGTHYNPDCKCKSCKLVMKNNPNPPSPEVREEGKKWCEKCKVMSYFPCHQVKPDKGCSCSSKYVDYALAHLPTCPMFPEVQGLKGGWDWKEEFDNELGGLARDMEGNDFTEEFLDFISKVEAEAYKRGINEGITARNQELKGQIFNREINEAQARAETIKERDTYWLEKIKSIKKIPTYVYDNQHHKEQTKLPMDFYSCFLEKDIDDFLSTLEEELLSKLKE